MEFGCKLGPWALAVLAIFFFATFILHWLSLCGRKRWWLLAVTRLWWPSQHWSEENLESKVWCYIRDSEMERSEPKAILGCMLSSRPALSQAKGGGRGRRRRERETDRHRDRISWVSYDGGLCL